MSACPNCKSVLTCGCQRRVASDGTACCQKCVASVNAKATVQQPIPQPEVKHNVVIPPPKP